MCGIAGKIHWRDAPGCPEVQIMSDALAHRGPDDSGVEHLPFISLAHRRLSIIDLSAEAGQPMKDATGRYRIIFNGEIYNFQEIKKELSVSGCQFRTKSDTEVILNAYAVWGERCLEKFNGMFAFAIWDTEKRELFIARDRFGKKPLYYHLGAEGGFSFASELSALMKDIAVPRKLDMSSLNCYLAIGYILSPHSMYEDVKKLESGRWMKITADKKIVIRQYWNYADHFREKTKESERDIAAHVLELLDASVKRRMIADVPVGAFLSGGIDSSSVVALMKRHHKGELHTFSIGFEQKSYNELDDADAMGRLLGTHHHGEIISSEQGKALLEEAIRCFYEPFADNSLIPMLHVSRLAAQHVKVALSGDGADELFAGYITYKADRYYRTAQLIPSSLRRLAFHVVSGRKLHSSQKINLSYKLRQFLYGSLQDSQGAHYSWRLYFNPEERIAILGEQYRQLVYDTDPVHVFRKHYDRVQDLDWLDQHLYVDGMTWLTDDILVKVDRTSMKCSLEARAPYLDKDLAEYAASIPSGLKLKGSTTKYILKVALKDILPKDTLYKKKSGFNAPVGQWIEIEKSDEFRSFNKFAFNTLINYGAKEAEGMA